MISKLVSLVKDLEAGSAIAILILTILKLAIKNKSFSKNSLQKDCDKEISWRQRDLDSMKPKSKYREERIAIIEDIGRLRFLKQYGYNWPKKKRDHFLKFRNMTNNILTTRKTKQIIADVKIIEGIIVIKMSNLTRFDVACHFSMSLLMLIIFPLLLILSFHITRHVEIGQLLFWILSGTAFIIAIYNLNHGFQKPLFLKRMKSEFDGMKID